MNLAKPRIDIGLNTNTLEPMLEFWQDVVGLPFDHMLAVKRGMRQHRHELVGSVLKINHYREPLPQHAPSGYHELLIAREGVTEVRALQDPDGNRVSLVPPGYLGVTRIGVRLNVRDPQAHRAFYTAALGLPALATHEHAPSCLAGDTVLILDRSDAAPADASMEGSGWRYITFQIYKVDEEHAHVLANGGREALAPKTLGETARISMVRDPDGNWIELSQRASITGSLH
jgi:catechol 2,3-dioxygenase-like lactoylglutathione lyase family enzyme